MNKEEIIVKIKEILIFVIGVIILVFIVGSLTDWMEQDVTWGDYDTKMESIIKQGTDLILLKIAGPAPIENVEGITKQLLEFINSVYKLKPRDEIKVLMSIKNNLVEYHDYQAIISIKKNLIEYRDFQTLDEMEKKKIEQIAIALKKKITERIAVVELLEKCKRGFIPKSWIKS